MAKVNVYLSDELEAEAREAGIKISPLCQAAVRDELIRLESVKGAQEDIRDVALRLLRTKEERDLKRFREGRSAGVDWARQNATLDDLERLAARFGRRWGRIDLDSYDTIQRFLFNRAISAGHDAEPDWFDHFDDDDAYDLGFIEGAHDVHEAVKPFVSNETSSD
jgi:hypothetical protein